MNQPQMYSYVIMMNEHRDYMDRLIYFVILNGETKIVANKQLSDKETAGKYIKQNVAELFDFFIEIAYNVKDETDLDKLSTVEKIVKKAYGKTTGNFMKKNKNPFIQKIKDGLSELSDEGVIDNFYSCNRKLLEEEAKFLASTMENDNQFYSKTKKILPHKTIEIAKFQKTLGKESIMYQTRFTIDDFVD